MNENEEKVMMREITVGDRVSFGRPESLRDPAVGRVVKVNRQTFQVELSTPWFQVKRTYPAGSRFNVSKNMISRLAQPGEFGPAVWGSTYE